MTENTKKSFSWNDLSGELVLFKRFHEVNNSIMVETREQNSWLMTISDDNWVELKQLEKKLSDNKEIMISVPDISSDEDMPKLIFIVQKKGIYHKQQQGN